MDSLSSLFKPIIVAFSGLDGVGKSLQSFLLSKVLLPSVVIKSPNYSHFSGRLLRSYLDEKEVYLSTDVASYPVKTKDFTPIQLALLNAIGFSTALPQLDHQSRSHTILDRWTLDMLTYQGRQGVDPKLLHDLASYFPEPDLTFLFLGDSFRDRQQGDRFERDDQLVWGLTQEFLTAAEANLMKPVEVMWLGGYTDLPDYATSILHVHQKIVQVINAQFNMGITPMSRSKICQEMKTMGLKDIQPVLPFDLDDPGLVVPVV